MYKMKHNRPPNIGIFCPSTNAHGLGPASIERGVLNMEQSGFEASFDRQIFDPSQDVLRLAGSGLERAMRLSDQVDDKSIDGLMSFWGGLNTSSMLDHVDGDRIIDSEKPVIGYSDATSLLLSLYAQGSEQVYHGPAFVSFTKSEYDPYNGVSLQTALSGEAFSYKHPRRGITAPQKSPSVLHNGFAAGKAVAGNLDTLLSISATKHAPEYDGAILFVEDAEYVDSRRFYRHMTQLEQSGITKKIAALCIGSFATRSAVDQLTLESIVKDTVPSSTPVITNLAFGHSDPVFTIPIGRQTSVEFEQSSYQINFTAK